MEGRGSITKSLRTCRQSGLGRVACSGGATRAVRPAAEENGGGGAPVVVSSEEEFGELQGGVGKLEVGSIGGEEG
jgi:hypothetical protein